LGCGRRAASEGQKSDATTSRADRAATNGGDSSSTNGGGAPVSRVIRMPGGVLPDGRGMVIPGLPALAVGESAILFLTRADATGMRMPVGLAQGRMRVVTDAAGRKSIVREQADLALVDARTGAAAQADAKAFYDYAATVAEIEARAAHKRATERR
jgi:hypothetical protein